jgi:transposase
VGADAKKKSLIASQRFRPDVVARREAFLAEVATISAERMVFIDESGAVLGMRSAYGYAPRGERCVEVVPFRTGRRVNLLGWMAAAGGSVRAHEGSVTAEVFETFVAESVVPHLSPGDVVIWDNARIHRPEAVALIEAVEARVLPQPPYSPDLNAIEPMWSKVKAIVKQKLADTREALLDALDEAVSAVTLSDAAGWIEHCGYLWLPE